MKPTPTDVDPFKIPDHISVPQSPLRMTGAFVSYLRQHFYYPENLINPILRENCVYYPGQNTGLMIESVTAWAIDKVQKRPGVIVKRGGFQTRKISLGNHTHPGNLKEELFTQQWMGTHQFQCCAHLALEAESLADEVYRYMMHYVTQLRQRLCLHEFHVHSISPIAKSPEGGPEGPYIVSVNVQHVHEESWYVNTESLPLRRVDLSITSTNNLKQNG